MHGLNQSVIGPIRESLKKINVLSGKTNERCVSLGDRGNRTSFRKTPFRIIGYANTVLFKLVLEEAFLVKHLDMQSMAA